MAELDELWYYPQEKLDLKHLAITGDDIFDTFAFLHTLPDHGNSLDLTSA